MIENLESELLPHLKEAKEIHVAVALMNTYGLDRIEETIPESCFRKYLVGTHLPTPPEVLQRLFDNEIQDSTRFSSRLHTSHSNYHPKVYLVKKNNDEWIAFVGSANATRGGFMSNVEMSISIEDQEKCKSLLEWFRKLYDKSSTLSQDFIDRYQVKYIRNRQLESARSSNDQHFFQEYTDQDNNTSVSATQFFNQSDFDAFAPPTHFESAGNFVEARAVVRQKMIDLHYSIFGQFPDYGIVNIYPASNKRNYTSQHFHSRGNYEVPKENIWLNYGKDRKDFTHHLRIQLILTNSIIHQYIGFWLFCKPHSGIDDRRRLQNGLENQIFLERLYRCVISLGDSYWIAIGVDFELNVSDIRDQNHLAEFLRNDDFSEYFIIARNYDPNHPNISIENIEETTLIEFSKLYKIYSLMTENVN